jgi:hypothetical protein
MSSFDLNIFENSDSCYDFEVREFFIDFDGKFWYNIISFFLIVNHFWINYAVF